MLVVNMRVYLGFSRETEHECMVEILSCGAGQITCYECDGDGDWTKYHPEPNTGPHVCVTCKGTGKIFISV